MDEPLLLPPSLLSIPGASLSLLEALFAQAADFFVLAPWKALGSETPLEVCYPQASPARTVVLMGSGGVTFGLCAYDRAEDLRRLLDAPDPVQAAGEVSWLALTFESSEYLAAVDRQAAQRHGWKVAGEQAYPAIARIGPPGPELRPPALSDLLWLEGALSTLNAFFGEHSGRELLPGTHRLKITALDGPAEALVTLGRAAGV
jgi:hypothetical protein